MLITEQKVIEICKLKVDVSKLTANNYTLCVDGTSCTKKTSILKATNRYVSKNQHVNSNQNSDTYFPSMIGYICSGINNLTCGGPHFEDRSPMNVLDWHFLWKIFDDYLKTFGNLEPKNNNLDMQNKLLKYKSIFNAYKNWYIYKMFSGQINTIALIDSNIGRCDSLRFARGENSDRERSQWKFYTAFQNLMYKELYEDLYIDLDWFGDADSCDVVSGISKYLVSVLDMLAARPNLDYAPLVDRRLPMPKMDYNLSNITTHTYRSIGRWGCQLILGNEEHLKTRIPSYVNVDNIKHPRGNMDEPIIASTRGYLFQSGGYNNNMDSYNGLSDNECTDDDCTMTEMFNN